MQYLAKPSVLHHMFSQFFMAIVWFKLNNCMNKRDIQQRRQTEQWLQQQGIQVSTIYVGTAELFQATKLATNTLRDWGRLLQHTEAHTLNAFLQRTRHTQQRGKITQGQCFKVMNIAKAAQRRAAKSRKQTQINTTSTSNTSCNTKGNTTGKTTSKSLV